MNDKTGTYVIVCAFRNPGANSPVQYATFTRDTLADAQAIAARYGGPEMLDGTADIYQVGPVIAHYRGGEVFEEKYRA